MTQRELDEILELHKLWRQNKGGKQADFSGMDLSNMDIMCEDLSFANFKCTNLSGTDLFDSILYGSDLRYVNLSGAYLQNVDLRHVDLRYANLSNTYLANTDLRFTNLSGAKGLINPTDYLNNNFEKINEGYIVYKTFENFYNIPNNWEIQPNSIIEEEVNYDRCEKGGCGINIATRKYIALYNTFKYPVWKLLIKWEWLPTVVVPYNTDGEIRCGKAMLLEVINE